jgi:hypothetical protein
MMHCANHWPVGPCRLGLLSGILRGMSFDVPTSPLPR